MKLKMKLKKIASMVFVLMLTLAVVIPANAEVINSPVSSIGDDTIQPRWIPVSVPDYYLTATTYDGKRYVFDTVYKEISLPTADHYYVQTGPKLKYTLYDEYIGDTQFRWVQKWIYEYEIKF